MGGKMSKKARIPGLKDPSILASGTPFRVNDVEALFELYVKLSSSLVNDGRLHKEQLQLALFKNSKKQNLFADRVFNLFDVKQDGHIEFDEFVQSLSIFHPKAAEADKITYAFRLYDLRHTGYIEREDTFMDADTKGDGRIDLDEWKEYVARNPSLLKNMTLPYLMDITLSFPSFVLNTKAEDLKLEG